MVNWQEAIMLGPRPFILLMVAVGSMELAGCGGEAARSAQAPRASSNSRQASLAAGHARSSNHDAPHEGFLSTYHNPEEGISFRYPRNYSLEEGDVQERSFFLKKQEDLDSEQPGATLVATVLIPEDGYPNTTFEHGSAQLVINEAGTEKSCRDRSVLTSSGSVLKTLTARGIGFRWSEEGSETGGATVLERAYAGYARGTCYEFFLTVAAEEAPDPDGFKKPADTARIMKQLEKIVSSAQIFTKTAAPAENTEEAGGPLVITTRGEHANALAAER
jgi:hypothetical protein